jgi:hypothetical protein|tara:strand:- start:2409 stop:2582 length:174 start_codon:yes stop_codon:yes gene_type:complete
MTIQQEFDKALKKFEQDFEKGTVSKDQFDKLEIWQQLLDAKGEAQREQDAKDVTRHG